MYYAGQNISAAFQLDRIAAIILFMEDNAGGFDTMSEQAEISRTAEVLAQISGALERVSDGVYGKCELCGAAIQHEILAADPLVRLCSTCSTTDTNGVSPIDSDIKMTPAADEYIQGYVIGESA